MYIQGWKDCCDRAMKFEQERLDEEAAKAALKAENTAKR
jgi:hypothetical protein